MMPFRALAAIPPEHHPDRRKSLDDYRELARGYDATCDYVVHVRLHAMDELNLKPGAVVLDIACGTGATLVQLAKRVGRTGRVVGVEQSLDMALIARQRIENCVLKNAIELVVKPVEEFGGALQVDAVLMCFTQDVLQNPLALEQIFKHAKPGARIAVTGVRLQPWFYAWPVNIWALLRSRRYFTTTRGLMKPWQPLLAYCPDLEIRRTYHLGLTYLAVGTYQPGRPN